VVAVDEAVDVQIVDVAADRPDGVRLRGAAYMSMLSPLHAHVEGRGASAPEFFPLPRRDGHLVSTLGDSITRAEASPAS